MAKKLSKQKAKKILKDGKVRGKKLTSKQKKFFGAMAGGEMPYREGTHKMPNGMMMKDSEMKSMMKRKSAYAKSERLTRVLKGRRS